MVMVVEFHREGAELGGVGGKRRKWGLLWWSRRKNWGLWWRNLGELKKLVVVDLKKKKMEMVGLDGGVFVEGVRRSWGRRLGGSPAWVIDRRRLVMLMVRGIW